MSTLYERQTASDTIEWRYFTNAVGGEPDFQLSGTTLHHGTGGKIVCSRVTLAQARRSLRQIGHDVESHVDAEVWDAHPARMEILDFWAKVADLQEEDE